MNTTHATVTDMMNTSIKSVHVTTWNHDEWTRGPYSTLGVGGRPHHRGDLAEPIDGRLVFAGEHTSVDYPATMHGAFNSGVLAAERLIAINRGAAKSEAQAGTAVDTAAPTATATVVGAGLAGLGAAQTFADAGWSVKILEATNRIGGRARTDQLASGLMIHPGAAWIHGPTGNPIATIADAVGTTGIDHWPTLAAAVRVDPIETAATDATAVTAVTANRTTSTLIATRLTTEQLARVEQESSRILRVLQNRATDARSNGIPDVSMRGALLAGLETIDDPQLQAATKAELDLHFESLMAADLDDLSFQFGDEPYAYPGGDRYLTTLLKPLITHLVGNHTVQLEAPVAAVSIGPNQVVTTLRSGETVLSDVCVVTIPLGALQNTLATGDLAVSPPLPASHLEALERLRMGDKCKVFVEFDSPWWGDLQQLSIFPSVPVLDAPTRWASWVDTSLPCGRPVLCGFVGGAEARRVQQLFLQPGGGSQLCDELNPLFAAVAQAL